VNAITVVLNERSSRTCNACDCGREAQFILVVTMGSPFTPVNHETALCWDHLNDLVDAGEAAIVDLRVLREIEEVIRARNLRFKEEMETNRCKGAREAAL
jgi:hypothetical protein